VDLYTCGDQCDPALAFNYLQDKFKASESNYLEFARGLMNPTTGKMMRHPARQVGSPTMRQVDFDNVTPLPTLRSAKEGTASSRA
jgi:hypothetical protein